MNAFVFSGGASLAAVQVGMLEALYEAGIRPDLCIGTSAGALNAAWVANHPDRPADDLARIWLSLRREDVFPASPMQLGLSLLSRRQNLVGPSGLRRLLETTLAARSIEAGPLPLAVVATDVLTGEEVVLKRGELVPALLASCALPGVYPPVRVGRRWLIDGGVSDNTPIGAAVDLGADTVYVLPSGYACALEQPPGSAVGIAVHALTLILQQRLIADVERLALHADIRVLPPLCPLSVSPVDFRHAGELIARSRAQARDWLAAGPPVGAADQLRFHPAHGRRRGSRSRVTAR